MKKSVIVVLCALCFFALVCASCATAGVQGADFPQSKARIEPFQSGGGGNDFWQQVRDNTKSNNQQPSQPQTSQPQQTAPKQSNPFQTGTNPLTGQTTQPKTSQPAQTQTQQPVAASQPAQTQTTTPAVGQPTANTEGRADPDAANWNISQLDTAKDATYLSALEKDVVLEMNKVRTNPSKYAQLYIQPRTGYFKGKNYSEPGKMTFVTNEGVAAVNECVTALKKAAAVGTLKPEPGLTQATRLLAADQAKTGQTGHFGSDNTGPDVRMKKYGSFTGSWTYGENISYGSNTARDIVCDLLIDDGVPNRGHRTNIMKKDFLQIGVGYGPHSQYRTMCVIDYAAGYVNK